ncbi:MAG: 3-hydroxyacyl-CoA dehydrogenase [Xanthomonadales bacterium]|nr:enoyl-CoA hydratase/isomerase family protein [Gammaproteobacteria bacterium]MBT8054255.1 enoyl-CoA hydratase/isomerase family protein [Gammaproteobacteria bacterium]NND57552.1 3-hydroxyacyl-CoA dehydrogenase [Xanthomonadales bacterium]NNK51276.1 3-hydroxyacyl-CoA dehydrogenase [Xanthomonadales bacterium]
MNNTIQYAVDTDGIALLTIDLPGMPMNVLTPELMEDLATLTAKAAADESVKGIVLTSGKKAFIAGADIKDMVTAYDRGISHKEAAEFSYKLNETLRKIETCGKPVAVAINGLALGGGLEVCLAGHYRVLANDTGAVLGFPEVNIGLLPGAGGTQRTPRLIGFRNAATMILQCKNQKPEKALEMGLVHELAPVAEVVERARSWVLEKGGFEQPWDKKGFRFPGGGLASPATAQTFMGGNALLAKATKHNYPAPIAAQSAIFEGCATSFDAGLRIESQYFGSLLAGPVARNMMRSLFVNKGKADKLARRPQGVEKSQVRKLGILGAGMMGAGIAYVSARAGMQVILLDTSQESAERGKAYSESLLKKAIERGYSTEEKAAALLGLITPTTNYHELQGCDLVIEAVFESVEIKADVTTKTEAVVPENCVFASNTSTLPITGLAKASERPEQFIGLHFFSPVDKMPLVEIILGEKTNDETIARSLDYIQQIRKTPIVVNDSRGFYTSRVFSTFTAEGITMLAEGVKPALIENTAKMAGMPVGPLAVTDEVTLELAYKIGKETAAQLGRKYPSDLSQEVIQKMVEVLDRRGKRFGKGFYDYPEGAKKHLWSGLAEQFPVADKQPEVDELKHRLLMIQALETARCFEEGVLTHAEDGDIGSIFGWGFPPYTGGTLSYIDTMGIQTFVAECDRMAASYGERFTVSSWLRDRAEKNQPFYG